MAKSIFVVEVTFNQRLKKGSSNWSMIREKCPLTNSNLLRWIILILCVLTQLDDKSLFYKITRFKLEFALPISDQVPLGK